MSRTDGSQNMIKEPQIFQIHMDGLDQILRHRGGVHTLDSHAALRMGLFWYIWTPCNRSRLG
jgi:hypothetical protein